MVARVLVWSYVHFASCYRTQSVQKGCFQFPFSPSSVIGFFYETNWLTISHSGECWVRMWNPSIYNIIRQVAWTMVQTNRQPRVWCSKYYFLNIFYRLRALKTLYFYFCNFIKNKKINWNDFCKEFCKKLWKKKNTWNIRRLVDETIIPSTHRPSVLYWRLSDFRKVAHKIQLTTLTRPKYWCFAVTDCDCNL